jgi:hypothetical protein
MNNLYSRRRALRSLRSGIVPTTHVTELIVGVSKLQTVLEAQTKCTHNGHFEPIVITGDWGTGKSTLLNFIRAHLLKCNFVVSYICLNGRSTPANHPQRFFHRIASNLYFPDSEIKGVMGMLGILKNSPERKALADKWISDNFQVSEFARGLYYYLNMNYESSIRIISGTDLYDWDYKKLKAIKRINDLGSFLINLGYKGFIVQFDELETITQLWNSLSRRSAYRHLNYLVKLNNIGFTLASTEKLRHLLKIDLNSVYYDGSSFLDLDAKEFVRTFLNLESINPPIIDTALAVELITKIKNLYQSVYKTNQLNNFQTTVIEKWRKMVFRDPRRLIRLTIDLLDVNRL